jgi:hypothetical protein
MMHKTQKLIEFKVVGESNWKHFYTRNRSLIDLQEAAEEIATLRFYRNILHPEDISNFELNIDCRYVGELEIKSFNIIAAKCKVSFNIAEVS